MIHYPLRSFHVCRGLEMTEEGVSLVRILPEYLVESTPTTLDTLWVVTSWQGLTGERSAGITLTEPGGFQLYNVSFVLPLGIEAQAETFVAQWIHGCDIPHIGMYRWRVSLDKSPLAEFPWPIREGQKPPSRHHVFRPGDPYFPDPTVGWSLLVYH